MGVSKSVVDQSASSPCRVVLFGDSITNGYQSWGNMFENDALLQSKLGEEGKEYTVEKCGINGERTSAMVDRFGDFCKEIKESGEGGDTTNMLFVFLGGTNDMARFQNFEDEDGHTSSTSGEGNGDALRVVANLHEMFKMASEGLGARVMCLTVPSMCIPNTTPTHIMYRYHVNNLLRKLCVDRGIPCVDLFTITSCPTTHKLIEAYSPDGLHLSPAAYEAAYTVLAQRIKSWGTAPPIGLVPTPYTIAVPESYRGLWRRDFIRRQNGVEDHDTRVLWLQGCRWHGDIRIPANRPSFNGVTSLDMCNEAQLQALLAQTGFVGVTDVTTTTPSSDGDGKVECCTWYQRGDYNPSNDIDAGKITFINEEMTLMEEVGLDDSYFEQWRRDTTTVPKSKRNEGAVLLTKLILDPVTEEVQVLLLVEGEHFFLYRNDRSAPCRSMKQAIEAWKLYGEASSSGGAAAVDDIVMALMRELASVEISYGSWGGEEGKILLSTYPWREGCTVTTNDASVSPIASSVGEAL